MSLHHPALDTVQILDPRQAGSGQGRTSASSASSAVMWSARVWGRVWVRLAADGSRAHGPRLEMRLVADSHPLALQAGREMQREQQQQQQGGVAGGLTPPRQLQGGDLPGECPLTSQAPPTASAAAAAKTTKVASAPEHGDGAEKAFTPLSRAAGPASLEEDSQEQASAAATAHFKPAPLQLPSALGGGISGARVGAASCAAKGIQPLMRALQAKLAECTAQLEQGERAERGRQGDGGCSDAVVIASCAMCRSG